MEEAPETPSTIIAQLQEHADVSTWSDEVPVRDYQLGFNSNRLLVYVSADLYPEGLDKGVDLSTSTNIINWVENVGAPEDVPSLIIPVRLGAPDCLHNVFPLSPKADTSNWVCDQDAVYNFLKGAQNKHVHMEYGFRYIEVDDMEEEDEEGSDEEDPNPYPHHPIRFYYGFTLFDGDTQVKTLEGALDN